MMTDLQAQLDILRHLQLIRPVSATGDEFTFQHALTLETAYESLLHRRRRQLHLEVAAQLERVPGIGAERAQLLAHHFWQAEAWEQAAEWALAAGDQAYHTFALREAMAQYEHALTALDRLSNVPEPTRFEALMGWSRAAFSFRPRAEILNHLVEAEQLARARQDREQLSSVLQAIANVNLAQGLPSRAYPALQELYRLARAQGDERLLVTPTFYMGLFALENDVSAALDYYAAAVELARRYDNADILAYGQSAMGLALARVGRRDEAIGAMDDALKTLDAVQSPLTISEVNLYASWTWLALGDLEKARVYGERGVETALAADNMECVCYGYACLGFRQLQSGQPEDAAQSFRETMRRAEFSGALHIHVLGRAGLASADFLQGHVEAIDELVLAYEDAVARQLGYTAALIAQTLGSFYLQLNDTQHAAFYLQLARAYYVRNGMHPAIQQVDALAEQLARLAPEHAVALATKEQTNE